MPYVLLPTYLISWRKKFLTSFCEIINIIILISAYAIFSHPKSQISLLKARVIWEIFQALNSYTRNVTAHSLIIHYSFSHTLLCNRSGNSQPILTDITCTFSYYSVLYCTDFVQQFGSWLQTRSTKLSFFVLVELVWRSQSNKHRLVYEAQMPWKCLFTPSLFWRAILTHKVGQTDLVFGVRVG